MIEYADGYGFWTSQFPLPFQLSRQSWIEDNTYKLRAIWEMEWEMITCCWCCLLWAKLFKLSECPLCTRDASWLCDAGLVSDAPVRMTLRECSNLPVKNYKYWNKIHRGNKVKITWFNKPNSIDERGSGQYVYKAPSRNVCFISLCLLTLIS